MNSISSLQTNPKRVWDKESYGTQSSLFSSTVTGLASSDPSIVDVTLRSLEHLMETYGHEPIRPSLYSEPPLRFSVGVLLGQIPISKTAKDKIQEIAVGRPELALETLLKPTTPEQLRNLGENLAYLETRDTLRNPNVQQSEFVQWANHPERKTEGTGYPTESIYETELENFFAAGTDGAAAPSGLDRVGTNEGYQELNRSSAEHVGVRPTLSRSRFDLIRSLASQPGRLQWAATQQPANDQVFADIARMRQGIRAVATQDPAQPVRPALRIDTEDDAAQERASREVAAGLAVLPHQRQNAMGILSRLKTDLTVRALRNRIEIDRSPGRVLARAGLSEAEQSILPQGLRESILVYGARREIGTLQKLALQHPMRDDVRRARAEEPTACEKLIPSWVRLARLNPEKAQLVLSNEVNAVIAQARQPVLARDSKPTHRHTGIPNA